MEKPIRVGHHLVFDLYGCRDRALLSDVEKLIELINTRVIQKFGLHCTSVSSYRFYPEGATVLFLLTESHVGVHTWPEYRYVSLDIFTCKKLSDVAEFTSQISREISSIFKPTHVVVHTFPRGWYRSNETNYIEQQDGVTFNYVFIDY